jgi:ABC-2 type transport system permease protein
MMPVMMRALVRLTWLEIKIFVREPMGVFGNVAIPVLLFVVLGRMAGDNLARAALRPGGVLPTMLPVLASLMMVLGAVGSLVTIISIYREGGILKRLRATPLSPVVILSAHVVVKLVFTAVTLALMVLAGRRAYPIGASVPLVSYGLALLLSTWAILSIGFLIASVVPTARFAQPLAGVVMTPMIALSGLFFPIERLPAALEGVARVLPLTYAVSLLDGIWRGETWQAHAGDVGALVVTFVVVTAVSSRVFRWE